MVGAASLPCAWRGGCWERAMLTGLGEVEGGRWLLGFATGSSGCDGSGAATELLCCCSWPSSAPGPSVAVLSAEGEVVLMLEALWAGRLDGACS
eukprot:scaffold160741_cov14-Tisochrysis_lutea.AAC.1